MDGPPDVQPLPPPARVLLVRLGAIGDCLRALPALAELRRRLPGAEIGWAVSDLAAPVVAGHPALTRVHVLARAELRSGPLAAWRELRRAAAEMRACRYEVAADLHTRLRSGYLVRASGAPLRIGLDRRSGTEANFLFTNRHVRLEDIYENRVTRFARILAPLGVDPAALDPGRALAVGPGEQARGATLYEEAGRPDVAVFPGTSSHRARDRYPLDRWREVVAGLGNAGLRTMVLWGPGEMDVAAELAAASPAASLAPATTLMEMAALIGRFRLYVGSNTAASHMAWMQGVPVVVLAGGRPWRTDRPLPPVPGEMLSAGGVEPRRKLRGEAARRAVEGIDPGDVIAASLRLCPVGPGVGRE